MTYYAVTAQYPVFTGLDGLPLENGFVYIGEENENPITNPITVYWDNGLLYPAAQPIRTLAGATSNSGTPSPIFTATSFSILVKDKNGNQVYFSKNGIKNYTDSSLELRHNYIMNGKFEVIQRLTPTDRWIHDSSGYTLVQTFFTFDLGQTTVPNNPTYYQRIYTGGGTGLAGDYARYVQVIEDYTKLAGQTITLSLWAKSSNGRTRFATSFDQVESFDPAVPVNQGIAPTIHEITSEFAQYSVTTTLPYLVGVGSEGIVDNRDTGLQLNIWIAAGTDFDAETNSLGHETGRLEIANVKLNRGSVVYNGDDRTFAEELALCERYYEKSDKEVGFHAGSNVEGSIAIEATSTSTDLDGFRFRTRKRTNSPSITVYSPDAAEQPDKVYRIGTGPVAVSSYNWINDVGVSALTLGSAKVVGDIYHYHYAVDAEFIL